MNVATEFDAKVGVTGVVLTRMDGDGRGGAALSMRAVTGKPIRFVGLGEKMDALETFDASRVAGRILGMGDIVALVEKAQQVLEVEQAERMMKRFQKGLFNINDLRGQLEQMQKMGGMSSVMGMMPGMAKMAKQAEAAGYDDKVVRHQIALINSMTKKERANPDLLQASRKKRIAAGAGLDVSDLNKLLKMQKQMADTMKKLGKMGKGGLMKQAMRAMTGKGGGLPDMENMDPAKLAEAQKMLADPRAWAASWAARACLPAWADCSARNDHAVPHPGSGDGTADPARAPGQRLAALAQLLSVGSRAVCGRRFARTQARRLLAGLRPPDRPLGDARFRDVRVLP